MTSHSHQRRYHKPDTSSSIQHFARHFKRFTKAYALVALLFVASSASGQRQLAVAINKDTLDWSRWELKLTEDEKMAIVEKLTTSNEIEWGLKTYSYSIWSLRDRFHIVDFNLDGHYDIIYNGFAGKSNNGIFFFENRNGKYKKVKEMYGDIVEIWQSDTWVALSFKVWNYRLCGNYVNFIETYVPKHTVQHGVDYVLSNKVAFVDGTAFPEKLPKSIPFKVTAEKARLLALPKEDTVLYKFAYTDRPTTKGSKPQSRLFHFTGNVTAVFETDAKGVVLAEREVDGKTWYFVRMSRYEQVNGIFCGKGHNNGATFFMMGWMDPATIEFIPLMREN